MDFFAQQDGARKRTLRLILLFLAAVVAVVGAVDLVVMFGLWWADIPPMSKLDHEILDGAVLVAIVVFAIRRLVKLRGGGEAIAKMVKARQVKRNTTDLDERRLLNVVDEMSIASGVAVPSVWVMDEEEGINAFAAGYSPNQAVIVVTRGTLTKLTRDELQGVIGHEFSHILNGDMRLNVRLIGILAGIVVVGEAGLVIIRIAAEANDAGAIPFVIWGATVAGVGYVGVFFGRMIKAAVSRQREFLADSSSVQFTRNPDGLVSALEKIRKEGAVLASPFAGEMSHMYFGQAIKPKLFSDLFATHPPIDERIASIQGRKLAPEAGSGSEGFAQSLVNSLIALVGNTTPDHVEHAANTVASLPESLRASLDTPEGARRAVYAYLFGGDPTTRSIQVRALTDAGDAGLAANIEELVKTLRGLGAASRLPVITLALPTLRHMDQPVRNAFLGAVDALIEADSEVTLDEFTLRTILRRQLCANAGRAERVKYKDVKAVRADMVLLLATLARAGASDETAQRAAFTKGCARIGAMESLPAGGKLAADAVGAALDRLRLVAPLAKPDIVGACVDTALADGKVTIPEMELLRAIGMAIDCPLPPTLEAKAAAA